MSEAQMDPDFEQVELAPGGVFRDYPKPEAFARLRAEVERLRNGREMREIVEESQKQALLWNANLQQAEAEVERLKQENAHLREQAVDHIRGDCPYCRASLAELKAANTVDHVALWRGRAEQAEAALGRLKMEDENHNALAGEYFDNWQKALTDAARLAAALADLKLACGVRQLLGTTHWIATIGGEMVSLELAVSNAERYFAALREHDSGVPVIDWKADAARLADALRLSVRIYEANRMWWPDEADAITSALREHEGQGEGDNEGAVPNEDGREQERK